MLPQNNEVESYKHLIKQLDEFLQNENWEASSVFMAIKKDLLALRDEFEEAIKEEENQLKGPKPHLYSHAIQREHHKSADTVHHTEERANVYVSLYCAQGNRLSQWERLVNHLDKHAINRPVYKSEEGMQEAIRSKQKPENEAYCIISVPKDSVQILPESAIPRDRLGHELLQLKEESIRLERLVHFVHQGVAYQLNDEGHLAKA